jgi:hypothetical protein
MELKIQLGNGYTVCINVNNLEKKEEIRPSNSNFNTLLNRDVVKHGVLLSYLNVSSATINIQFSPVLF